MKNLYSRPFYVLNKWIRKIIKLRERKYYVIVTKYRIKIIIILCQIKRIENVYWLKILNKKKKETF